MMPEQENTEDPQMLESPPLKTTSTTTSSVFTEESTPPQPESTTTTAEEADSEAERLQREEEESLLLARAFMAEEAMASYEQHFSILREQVQAGQLSEEERQVWQVAMEEEEREEVELEEDEEGNLDYDALLQLGERIGDVKSERWAMVAKQHVEKLPVFTFQKTDDHDNLDVDAERKCLVCQCDYEDQEELCRLPCNHCYHKTCVASWLSEKDFCPYCRQSIVLSAAADSV
jgi:hypothetical protein